MSFFSPSTVHDIGNNTWEDYPMSPVCAFTGPEKMGFFTKMKEKQIHFCQQTWIMHQYIADDDDHHHHTNSAPWSTIV